METLKEQMLKALFIQTGGRKENPKIAWICADIAEKWLREQVLKNSKFNVDDIVTKYADKISDFKSEEWSDTIRFNKISDALQDFSGELLKFRSTESIEGKKWTQERLMEYLPAVISDMKHETTSESKMLTQENIKRKLFFRVILSLYSEEGFLSNEKINDGTGRMGCFIKGYCRDVWDYLEQAYDIIHNQDFVLVKTEEPK